MTKEVAIDAMFGTNNAGKDLFAVPAELDGTGILIAHIFVEKRAMVESTPVGTMKEILDQFLRPLQQSGLNPSFVGCDKDKFEVNVTNQVWPSAKLQLWFWHAKRTIKAKLSSSSRVNPFIHYTSEEARGLIPNLEIRWGS